jgi:hypothetical protein
MYLWSVLGGVQPISEKLDDLSSYHPTFHHAFADFHEKSLQVTTTGNDYCCSQLCLQIAAEICSRFP